jgi:hypothetical protein
MVLSDTETQCFAWATLPNHFHLLLKTGATPIATVMKRLLTGYAMHYNRRHHRHGHLFQNRYKSILCQSDLGVSQVWLSKKLGLSQAAISLSVARGRQIASQKKYEIGNL